MINKSFELSNYHSVDFLWNQLIEEFGCEKAKKLVSQALDLQRMHGRKNDTMPIIFSGTGGSALISIEKVEKETSAINLNNKQVLIFNPRGKSFQVLKETE